MKHLSIETLALLHGGELPLLARWKARRHVASCPQCQKELHAFSAVSHAAAADAAAMPPGVDWNTLAAEMRANIHLGLEASEAIRAYDVQVEAQRPGLSWKGALVAASLAILSMAGYWMGAVKKQESLAVLRGPDPVIIEASQREGVGLSDGKKTLALMAPKDHKNAEIVSVSTAGSAGARYVDEETGQVTVNNVYLD